MLLHNCLEEDSSLIFLLGRRCQRLPPGRLNNEIQPISFSQLIKRFRRSSFLNAY